MPSLPSPTGHVHHYRSSVAWAGSTGAGYERYDRTHRAVTDPPTVELALSSDPAFRGDPRLLDPEQLLVTAAASCQLLAFLAVAARARLDVVDYRDEAEAVMPEDDHPTRITHITLRPAITVRAPEGTVAGDALVSRVRHLVEVAHHECYIANTLTAGMTIEPTVTVITGAPAGPGR